MKDKCGKKIKEGEIPKDYYTSEISCERYLEEKINGIKS